MAFGTISKFNHDANEGLLVLVHVTELAKAEINVFSKIELKRRISYDILIDKNNQQRAMKSRSSKLTAIYSYKSRTKTNVLDTNPS